MNLILEYPDVPLEQFEAIVKGEARVEVILHCANGVDKLSAAVRMEQGHAKGFLDVSKE